MSNIQKFRKKLLFLVGETIIKDIKTHPPNFGNDFREGGLDVIN